MRTFNSHSTQQRASRDQHSYACQHRHHAAESELEMRDRTAETRYRANCTAAPAYIFGLQRNCTAGVLACALCCIAGG